MRFAVVVLLAIGCAGKTRAVPPVPVIPPARTFAPAVTPAPDTGDAPDYRSIAVVAPNACGLPTGILVSHPGQARAIVAQSERSACQAELAACAGHGDELRATCVDLDAAHRRNAERLVEPPEWWNRFWIGAAAGAAAILGGAWAVGRVR